MTNVALPHAVAATASASATLAKGKHTPVDASAGALTMTLSTTAAAGVEVSVEKVDASANAVTVSGTFRGAASTLTLTTQYEARTFLSEGGGSWRPVSDHRTKASLDATYATAASVGAAYSLATSGKPVPTAPVATMVSNLQTGHGWTNINGTATLNDTGDFALGTQSAKIVTNGTGTATSFDKTGLTVDATGKFIRLWLKISDLSKLNTMQLYLGDATLANNWNGQIANGTVAWRNTQSVIRTGEWTVLDVPFTDLTSVTGTPSRAAITRARITFTDQSTGPVTVSLNGLALVSEQTVFPNGVISLTFDDNPTAQYTAARPKMDQYGYAGTLYPVIDQIGAAGQMTLAQMTNLQNLNGWDFGAHASTLAQHIAGLQGLTEAALVAEFETIRAWMRANGLRGESFAWPNGDSDTLAETVCARYFRSARTVYNRSHEVLPPANPFRLRAVNPTSMTLAQMKAEVDAAKNGKYWLNFIFHDLPATKSKQNDVALSDFQALVDYINGAAVPVRTVSQVLAVTF